MKTDSNIERRRFLKIGALSAAGLPVLSGPAGTFAGTPARSDSEEAVKGAAKFKLQASVGKVGLAPPLGFPMAGYAARKGVAEGSLDPLYARILALEAGDTRLALITLDLIGPLDKESLDHRGESVKQSSNVSCLIAAASHTHSGPALKSRSSDGTSSWEATALNEISKAIDRAFGNLGEARLGVGHAIADIAYNRRRINSDGTVGMLWSNPARVPTAPVDPVATILRVDRADGSPLAVLVNHACHGVVVGADNHDYSADWPGAMAEVVAESMGNEPLCFFLQGAAGDINPYYASTLIQDGAVSLRDWTGERVGKEVARVAKDIRTQAESSPEIQFRSDVLIVHDRCNPEAYRDALIEECGASSPRPLPPQGLPAINLPVSTVLINRQIAWMTAPGEMFVEFQTSWRNQCPVPYAFFLGYANGSCGYIPTILAASQGGYGAAGTSTHVAVGTGERLVNHTLVRTYEMLGKLTDVP